MTTDSPARSHAEGKIIEYTSFDPAGYSKGQVVRYTPGSQQWQLCPNCGQQAVPGEAADDGLRRCPRCQASVRLPALTDLLVYIRSRSGDKPFQGRESQLRRRMKPAS